jgi:signal transduction histidine kinase
VRITSQLRIGSAATIAALVLLASFLTWTFIEFNSAKNDYALASAILENSLERASFRDQYFLYREDRMRTQWDANKKAADDLLRQAELQFNNDEYLQVLDRLHRIIEESASIFHRIVSNTAVLKAAGGNRQVYAELDKRLSSQLLLKAAVIRDTATTLKEASAQRVERTYKRLTIIIGVFAVALALATILTSMLLGRLIRKRLKPLHDGARIVADGNLGYRIECEGSDEFSELALSINAMTDKLQAFTAQLEASNAELEEFSYSMSHDMRTPLRALDGFSKILLDEHAATLGDEGKRLLKALRDNAQRMGRLIDDILHYLSVSRQRMQFSSIDIAELASEIFAELQAQTPERLLRLEIGTLPPALGDRNMIREVLQNLLSNSIKFSLVDVQARIEICGVAKEGENVYSVTDHGIGFDMHYADKLFRVFERVHATGQYEGSGIGLALVKRIISRHGGRVWAEGKLNEGATIYFALPTKKLVMDDVVRAQRV